MGKNTGIWQNERWKTTVFQNAGIDTLSRLDCRNRFRSSHVSKQRLQPLIHPNLVQVLFKSFRILFFNSSISIVQSLYFFLEEVVSLLLDRSLSYMFLIFYRPELWLCDSVIAFHFIVLSSGCIGLPQRNEKTEPGADVFFPVKSYCCYSIPKERIGFFPLFQTP